MIVEFEGQRHEFPDDATQTDIAHALSAHTSKPMPQVMAALVGAESGMSAGFSDEIAGARAASGVPRAIESSAPGSFGKVLRVGAESLPMAAPLEAAYGAARYGYETLTGQPGQATADYTTARDEKRAEQHAAEEQYPKTYMAGEIGGALALPVSRGVQAATLPVRAARAAASGAGVGALTGVGQSEGGVADALTRAVVGGVAGGGLGAAGVPVAEAIAQVAQRAAPYIAPVIARATAPIRAAFRPRDEAARQVVTGLRRDAASDPNALSRLTPAEFAQSVQEGGPAAIVDTGGNLTRRLADVAAITSPEAATTLRGLIDPRFEQQSPRLAGWLRESFNYPDAAAQQEAIDTAARAANRPAYARAQAEAARLHPAGLWDETFEQLSQDPTVQAAIRAANVTSRSAAARQGVTQSRPITPIRNPFIMDANGRMVLRADDPQARPTLAFWDEVKKNLDRTGSFEARSMARTLREHIDSMVPSYQAARAGAAHFFGAENALEAGQNFVGASGRYGLPAARRALAQMSPQERQLFQDGYVSRLVEKIEATGDRRSVLNQISQSPAAREEIRMALGPQRADQLEARLRVEGIIDLVRGAVQGNSWTARRLYDLGLAGGAGLGLEGGIHQDPRDLAIGGIVAALSSGGKRINANVMRHVAELLVSNDPGQLARGVRIVAGNNRLLDALRATDQRLANISGEQSANLPAIQAGGVSAAQGNQQQVPRPPGQ